MIRRTLLIAITASLLVVAALYANSGTGSSPDQTLRRFALFVGANNGGPGRNRLMYAVTDAKSMASVMYDVGGLQKEDSIIAVEPSPADLEQKIAEMRTIIRERKTETSAASSARTSGVRTEFVLYYSGHSDENGLLLGGRRFSYRDLHNALKAMNTDVSIVILDSCDSGAFIRLKGGQRVAPFLMDESSKMKGQVYLTSSSEDEASQESDAIGGSFFTQALISGLRGAADVSQDGKVTLDEAYQFARSETTERTENSAAGPQHPAWHIELTGTGDLVLTDIRSLSAGLTMAKDVDGRIAVRDRYGKLVVELHKAPGTPLSLALPPGDYRISAGTSSVYLEASVSLHNGRWTEVALRDFSRSSRVASRRRGGESTGSAAGTEDDFLATDWGLADAGRVLENTVKDFLRRRAAPETSAAEGAASSTSQSEDVAEPSGTTSSSGARPEPLPTARSNRDRQDAVPVSFSFVPGIGFPLLSFQTVKQLSFNLIVGESYAIHGAEFGAVMNIVSKDVSGLQLSGVGNIVGGPVRWAQGAGVFNIAGGRVQGVQAAGVFNIAGGGVKGVQAAGVFNIAGDRAEAVQAAGVFNVAGELTGAQLGVVNIAGPAKGLQVGVVNIAGEMQGLAIGLVNIASNGLISTSVSSNSDGIVYADFESGKTLYSVLYAGYKQSGDQSLLSYGAGLGLHFGFGPFFTEIDASAKNLYEIHPDGTFYPSAAVPFLSARAKVGILLFGHLGGFIGYTFDAKAPWNQSNPYAFSGSSWQLGSGDSGLTVYPKFTAGVTLRL